MGLRRWLGCDGPGRALVPASTHGALEDQLEFMALRLDLHEQAFAQIARGHADGIELPHNIEGGGQMTRARSARAGGSSATRE